MRIIVMELCTIVFVFGVSCALVCPEPALATLEYGIVYETDPGFVTDQLANYYATNEGTNEVYHVRVENHAPGSDYGVPSDYQPNRYFVVNPPEPLNVVSFELQWDIQMTRLDWSAGVEFGVYDARLDGAAGVGGQSIQVDFGRGDSGRVLNFQVRGPGGSNIILGPAFDVGTWYTCAISYDDAAKTVGFTVDDRDGTGGNIWTLSDLDIPGGAFTNELVFVGGSRYGMGDDGNYHGVDPKAVAEANIDNVRLIPEPGRSCCLDSADCRF